MSLDVKFESLGSLDLNKNGRRALLGMRVDPSSRKGVWAGFWTLGNNVFVVITDGSVTAGETLVQSQFVYKVDVEYQLTLEVSGSRAKLFVNGKRVLETNEVKHLKAGTTALWITGPPSTGRPISVVVDNWRTELARFDNSFRSAEGSQPATICCAHFRHVGRRRQGCTDPIVGQ